MTKLKEKREERGLRLCDLSAKSKVNYFNLSRYEAGYVSPGPKTIRHLCDALECTAEEIGFGEGGE